MKFLSLLLLSFLVSCASTTPGIQSKSKISTELEVWGVEESVPEGYRLITFSFKNPSKKWKRVKEVHIEFIEPKLNDQVKILIGSDLMTWLQSITHENNVSLYNRDLLLGSLAVGLATTSIATNSKAAAIGSLGAIGAIGAVSINDSLRNAQIGKQVPNGHLLSSFSVPPGLVTQRWIALEYHGDDPLHVNIESNILSMKVEYLDGTIETHEL